MMKVFGSLTKVNVNARLMRHVLNCWPPFVGAGIRVETLSRDFRYAKIAMPLTWYNRNYVGSHFGTARKFQVIGLVTLLCFQYYCSALGTFTLTPSSPLPTHSNDENAGGSLYSMTDPWYMLMLLNVLGSDFIVWDKGGRINYVAPGRSCVTAEFVLDANLVRSLRGLDPEEKRVFDLPVVVVQEKDGKLVAEVTKTMYVKRKGQKEASTTINSTTGGDQST